MVSKKSNLINMNNSDLKKLSKSELIKLLLKQNARKHIKIEIMDDKPVPKPRRPVPTPRKSVKDMVQQYEDNIIIQPSEKPIPAPRTKKTIRKTHSSTKNQKNHQKNQFLKKELSFHKLKKP